MVIDAEWGDVMSPSTRDFWLRAVRERYVVAALGGPPCETWSQAREHAFQVIDVDLELFVPRIRRGVVALFA